MKRRLLETRLPMELRLVMSEILKFDDSAFNRSEPSSSQARFSDADSGPN